MELKKEKLDGITFIQVPYERLDAGVAIEFKKQMMEIINEDNYKILLDLSVVENIDSSGLGAIVSCLKSIGNKGDIVLLGINENIKILFGLTRMDKVFRFFDDKEEALNALK